MVLQMVNPTEPTTIARLYMDYLNSLLIKGLDPGKHALNINEWTEAVTGTGRFILTVKNAK